MKRIDIPPAPNTVWAPIPGTSQEIALDTRCHITLYSGTRGPGKTECQLMRFKRRVGMGYGSHWRGIIFDREYKNLDDIKIKSQRLFPLFKDGAKFRESKGDYKWSWPTGEELLLRVVKKDEDYADYHGHEYPFIGWNELTKYPNSTLFDKMMSVNRSGFLSNGSIPPIPLEVFATTNPHGPGHNWVKRRFIDVAPYGKVVEREVTLDKPGGHGEKVTVKRTQVALFGNWRENPYLDPAYIAELMNEKNEALRKAWLDGNWDIVAGGAIDDVWNRKNHVVPRFVIPKAWRIDRAFDWGSSHPYYVGWFAQSDGTEAEIIDEHGRHWRFCPPKGSIVLFAEIYGTEEIGTNKGLKHSSKEIALRIKEYETFMLDAGWIRSKPHDGPADNQIWNSNESDEPCIADKMLKEGIGWTRSNKASGSRKNGLQLVRDRLQAVLDGEGPGLYITQNCQAAISTIPVLPRDIKDPDDVDTTAEDHPYDVVRYRVLDSAKILTAPLEFTFT